MTSVPTLYQTPPQSQHAQQGPPIANLPNPVAPPPMGGLLAGNIPGAGAPGVYSLANQQLQRGIQQQQMIPQSFGPQSGQVPQSMTSLQPNAPGLPNMNFNGPQVFRTRQQQPGPRSQLPLQTQQNPMMPTSSNLAHLQQNGLLGVSMNNANLQQPFRSPIPAVGQSQQFLRQQPGVSPSPASQQPTLQGAPGQPGQQQQQQPSGPAQLNHMQVMPSNLHREFSTAQGLPQGQQPQQSPGQMQLPPQHQRAGSLGMNLPAGISATAGGMMQRPVMTNLSTQPPPPTLTQAHVQAQQQPQQPQQMHPANAMNPSMHPHQQQQQQSHQSANPSSAPPFPNSMVMHQNNPHQLGQQPQSQGMHAGGPLGMQASAGHIGPMGVGMGAGLGGVVGTNGGPSPPQRPGSHQHGLPHSQPQTPSGTPMTTAPGPIPVRPQSRTTGIGGSLGMGDKGMMNANVVGGGVGMGVSGSNAGAGMQQYSQVMSSLQNHQPMAALAPMNRLAGPQPGVGGAQNQPPGGAPVPVPGPSGAGAPYAFQQANMGGGRTTPSHTPMPMASLTASASGPSAVGSRPPMGSMPPYGMQNPGVAHGQTFMTPAQMYGAHGNPGVAGIASGDAQRPPSRQRLGQQPLTHPGGAGAPGMGTPGIVHPPGAQFGGSGRQTPGSQMVGGPPSQMSPARPGSAMHHHQQQQGHQPHPSGTPGMAHPSTPHLVNTQPAHHAMGQDQQQQQQQQQQALNMQHLRSQQAQQALQQHQQQSAQQQHIMAHLPQQAGRSQSPAVNAQQHSSGGPGGMGQAGQVMSSVQGQPGQVQVQMQSGVNRTPRTQTAQLPPQPGSTQQQQQQPPPMSSLGQTSLVTMGLRTGMGPPQQLGMQQQQSQQQQGHQQPQGQQQGVPSPKQRPPSTVQHGQQASVGQQQPVQQTSPSHRASQTPIPPSPRQVQQQGQQGQQSTTGPQAPTQAGQPLPPPPPSSVQTGGTSSIAPIPIQASATGVAQLARGSVVGMPPFGPGQQQPVVGPVGVGVGGMPPTPGGAGVPLGVVRGPVTMTDGTPIHSSYQMPATAALARFLQFSGVLASGSNDRVRLDYWKGVVHDFFTERAVVVITLWKDSQRTEAKPFDIGVPILPRFFLITSQSGVKSMSFTLDNAAESTGRGGTSTIECPTASWTYRYDNGYTVVLKGPLLISAQFVPSAGNRYTIKFDSIRFDAYEHEKSLSIDAIIGHRNEPMLTPTPRIRNANTPGTTPNMAHAEDSRSSQSQAQTQDEYRIIIEKANIPTEPVNAFGIPQATMRCLELAESVAQMDELIRFSTKTNMGPIDALKTFCENMRQDGGVHLINGAPQRPGDQSSPLMASTPSASAQTPTNGPHPAGPSGSTTSTPQLTNATLKRKNQAGDASSPTTGPGEQPPAKRANRKRKMTAGGS